LEINENIYSKNDIVLIFKLTYFRTRASIDSDTELQSDRELQQFVASTKLHTRFFILNDHFHNKTVNDSILYLQNSTQTISYASLWKK
jgi:hypothetical protein